MSTTDVFPVAATEIDVPVMEPTVSMAVDDAIVEENKADVIEEHAALEKEPSEVIAPSAAASEVVVVAGSVRGGEPLNAGSVRGGEPLKPLKSLKPLTTTTRVRKAVQPFAPEPPKREETVLTVEAGTGTKLGEIESIAEKIDTTNAQDGALKALFAACFPTHKTGNTKLVIKKNLRAFSGYSGADASGLKTSAASKIERYDGTTLKAVCRLLCISPSGPKATSIEQIVAFLASPASSAGSSKRSSAGSKRKSTTTTKKKPTKKNTKGKRTSTKKTTNKAKKAKKARDEDDDDDDDGDNEDEEEDGDDAVEGDASDDHESSSDAAKEEEEDASTKKKKKKAKTESAPTAVMADELREQLIKSISAVLADADLTKLSMSAVRASLAAQHGDVTETHKAEIKTLVMKAIAERA